MTRGGGARRGRSTALVAALLLSALAIVALRHLPPEPPLSGVEDRLIDLRFQLRGPRPAPQSVLVVEIDDASLARIGLMAPMRRALAAAIPRLGDAGAAAVVIDLTLIEPTEADGALAAELAAEPGVVLAVAGVGHGAAAADPAPVLRASGFAVVAGFGAAAGEPELLVPAPELAGAARLGHVNIALSPDRVARRAPLALPLGGGAALPAASLIAAVRATGLGAADLELWRGQGVRMGGRMIATDRAGRVLINHFGGPRTLETVSLAALLDGEVAPGRIAGRAVFIGASAESLRDLFATPYAPDVAGVELLATLAANLIGGDVIRSGGGLWGATAALALGVVAVAAVAIAAPASPVRAVIATLAVWAVAAAALQVAFGRGAALDATSVLAALGLATAALWVWRLRVDHLGARRVETERSRLSGFVSPFASAALARGGAAPVWRTEPATVAFVDVAGSVGFAEAAAPEETAAFLAGVQGRIARAAAAHGGAVVERFGDGALVVFGFGGSGGAAEALAFAAALGTGDAAGPRLRVTLQHGPVALADLGGGDWGHVTVAGDTVNVAARLQDAAKRAGVAIVVGRAVLDAAGVQAVASGGLRPLAPEPVRGRRAPVEVWAVEG